VINSNVKSTYDMHVFIISYSLKNKFPQAFNVYALLRFPANEITWQGSSYGF
jgi:hypothetical protein